MSVVGYIAWLAVIVVIITLSKLGGDNIYTAIMLGLSLGALGAAAICGVVIGWAIRERKRVFEYFMVQADLVWRGTLPYDSMSAENRRQACLEALALVRRSPSVNIYYALGRHFGEGPTSLGQRVDELQQELDEEDLELDDTDPQQESPPPPWDTDQGPGEGSWIIPAETLPPQKPAKASMSLFRRKRAIDLDN